MTFSLNFANLQNAVLAAIPGNLSARPDEMASSLPSTRKLSKLAFAGAQAIVGYGSGSRAASPAVCSSPQLSCHNTTAISNLCCFNAPGGQLLLTQFWDTDPVTGPTDSWTIHGLWPDHCDGTYDSTCDSSRQYTNIGDILTSFGKDEVLSYMQTYWKDYSGDDESFWEHEWGKHGTCVSTLEPSCYSGYQSKQEVSDYFNKTVQLFQSLPSYEWLSAAGITPSTSQTYSVADIQAALGQNHDGKEVTLGCSNGELNEIWYHFNVRGSVQDGEFVAADPDGTKSSCPDTGIRYLPKDGSRGGGSSTTTSGRSSPTTTTSATASPTGSGTPFSGKGHLNVVTGGSNTGCIISYGTWYTTGTCATFTAASSGDGFTLTSSRGTCGIVAGVLKCDSSVSSATVFTASGINLATDEGDKFYADSVPRGSTQATVYTAGHDIELAISWQGV